MKRVAIVLGAAVMFVWALSFFVQRGRPAQLVGLWRLGDARVLSDELVFYYFHKDGKGLYRYGQAGLNQTHSFDWRIEGDALALTFRKTGEHARTRFALGEDGGTRTLTLIEDPRAQQPTPGRVRYKYTPTSLAVVRDELGGPLALPKTEAEDGTSLVGRIWADFRRYATGGSGFRMYQLAEHDLPDLHGWKLGWYHQGDFDDWTTETLAYKQEPGALRLRFLLRQDEQVTHIELKPARERRTMFLSRDPRNFLHIGRFVDAGRSF